MNTETTREVTGKEYMNVLLAEKNSQRNLFFDSIKFGYIPPKKNTSVTFVINPINSRQILIYIKECTKRNSNATNVIVFSPIYVT